MGNEQQQQPGAGNQDNPGNENNSNNADNNQGNNNEGNVNNNQQKKDDLDDLENDKDLKNVENIKFTFNKNQDKYDILINKIENLINLINTDNPLSILSSLYSSKLLVPTIKTDDNKNKLKKLMTDSKTEIVNYYSLFKRVLTITENIYTNCQKFIDEFLENVQENDKDKEVLKKENSDKTHNANKDLVPQLNEAMNGFKRFEVVFNDLKALCQILFIEDEGIEDTNKIKQNYSGKSEQIKGIFDIKTEQEYIEIVNNLIEYKHFFGNKIKLIESFKDAAMGIDTLFIQVTEGLTNVYDDFETITEINQYFLLGIKNRLICYVQFLVENLDKAIQDSELFHDDGDNNKA